MSLPLVEIGSDHETWGRNNFGGYASSYAPYLTGTDQNFDNTGNIISVVNSSTEGIKITALVDCFLNCNTRFQFSTANSGHAAWVKNNAIADVTGIDKDKFISALGYVGSTVAQNVGVTLPVINEPLKAGDYVRLLTDGDTFNTGDANPRVLINAVRDRGNTNMAHIIKPAVAVLEEHVAQNTAGGAVTGGTYLVRKPNVWSGETWFVSGSTGTLGLGGTNTQFDLQAGTYEVEGFSCTHKTDAAFSRFASVNTSTGAVDGVVDIFGVNNYVAASSNGDARCPFQGTFTITESKSFRIYTYPQSTEGTYGGGVQANVSGRPEIYMSCKIRKLK